MNYLPFFFLILKPSFFSLSKMILELSAEVSKIEAATRSCDRSKPTSE
ncbi:MAG TPA: hypothetical protein VK184_12595 [Nostocaceae cyanobacterium]|nr:hypothetical protein [Nostocaceae cyanobacterium]